MIKIFFSSSTFWQLSVLIDTPLHVSNITHGSLALFIICLEGCKGGLLTDVRMIGITIHATLFNADTTI